MKTGTCRPAAVICDIDGTLVDVRSIRHLVDRPGHRDFDAFHSASIACPPHLRVLRLLEESNAKGTLTAIVTGRDERWSFLTSLWLHEHGVEYDTLLMRRRGDNRADGQVKQDFASLLVQRYDVQVAIDDRDDILSVWQRFGIPTVKVTFDGRLEVCDAS